MEQHYKDKLNLVAIKLKNTSSWNSPVAWRMELANTGITSLDLPKCYGGSDFTFSKIMEFFSFCGYFDLDLRDVPGSGHGQLLLGAKNTNLYQAKILKDLASSKEFIGITVTEENSGSDIRNIQTTAYPATGGYVLNGSKHYVARLNQATRAIIFAKVVNQDEELFTVFITPLDLEGMSTTNLNALGLKGVSFGGLNLDNVFVPYEMRIGEEGEGFKLFSRHFTYWRIAMAAAAIGCARAALNQAVYRLQTRDTFGGPIGRFSHLQQDLSRHVANLYMANLLVEDASKRLDMNLFLVEDGAMVKAEAVEKSAEATDWAMKIHGALGYTDHLDLEKRFRDLLGLRVADGATDVMRSQVARTLLGENIYELSLGRNLPKKFSQKTTNYLTSFLSQ